MAGLDHTEKSDRTIGDEKGGVWTYVTDDLNWADLPDTGYLHQHKKINSILLVYLFLLCSVLIFRILCSTRRCSCFTKV